MKRAVLIFAIIAMVVISVAFWLFYSMQEFNILDSLHVIVIVLVLIFAGYVGFKRLSGAKRGEPDEDEMSKKIIQKTAAYSYYISLYWWVVLMIIKDRVLMDSDQLIGTGILGMAISFAICWMVLHFRGVRDDQ